MDITISDDLKKNMYISFEGPECSGKSTQVSTLTNWLKEGGIEVLKTKEPGCTIDPVCTGIRKLLLDPSNPVVEKSAFLLFLADRSQHLEKVVIPHLNCGYTVVSDRSSLSTLVYYLASREAMWDFSEIAMETMASWLSFAQPKSPDLCFVATSDHEFAQEIFQERGVIDRIESKGKSFHDKVRIYFDMFATENSCPEVNYFSQQAFFPKKIYKLPAIPTSSPDTISSFIRGKLAAAEAQKTQD